VRSETKIFNLETHEFGSNPPLKKNIPPFSFRTAKWREQSALKNWWEMSRYFWRELEL
jgi:hypothetical protein